MKRNTLALALCCALGVCTLTACNSVTETIQQVQLSPEEAKKQAFEKLLEDKNIELYKILNVGESGDEVIVTSSALTSERFGYLSEARFYQYVEDDQSYKLLPDLTRPLWSTDIYKPVEGIPSEMMLHYIYQGKNNEIFYKIAYGANQLDRLVKTEDGIKWESLIEKRPLSLSDGNLSGDINRKYKLKELTWLPNATPADKVSASEIKKAQDEGRFVAKGKLLYVTTAQLAELEGKSEPQYSSDDFKVLILQFDEETEVPVFIQDDPNIPVGYSTGHNEMKKIKFIDLRIKDGMKFDSEALNSNHELFDGNEVYVSIDPSVGGEGFPNGADRYPPYFYFYKFL